MAEPAEALSATTPAAPEAEDLALDDVAPEDAAHEDVTPSDMAPEVAATPVAAAAPEGVGASDETAPAPAPVVQQLPEAVEDPNRPRRTGWWSKRASGG